MELQFDAVGLGVEPDRGLAERIEARIETGLLGQWYIACKSVQVKAGAPFGTKLLGDAREAAEVGRDELHVGAGVAQEPLGLARATEATEGDDLQVAGAKVVGVEAERAVEVIEGSGPDAGEVASALKDSSLPLMIPLIILGAGIVFRLPLEPLEVTR